MFRIDSFLADDGMIIENSEDAEEVINKMENIGMSFVLVINK